MEEQYRAEHLAHIQKTRLREDHPIPPVESPRQPTDGGFPAEEHNTNNNRKRSNNANINNNKISSIYFVLQ